MLELGYYIKEGTFLGYSEKCILVDHEYGEWVAIPADVYCRKRRHPKRATKEVFDKLRLTEDQVNYKLKNRNITLKPGTYKGSSFKATFVDEVYGEWEASALNVIYNKSNHPERGQHNKSLSQNRKCIFKHWKRYYMCR